MLAFSKCSHLVMGPPPVPFGDICSEHKSPSPFAVKVSEALRWGSLASQPLGTARNTCRRG